MFNNKRNDHALQSYANISIFQTFFQQQKNQKEKQNLNIHCVSILDKQKQRQTHV